MSYIHLLGEHMWEMTIFGESWFRPVLEPFVVPNWPILRAPSDLRGAKIVQHKLKMDSMHLFVHHPLSKNLFLKNTSFDPFLTQFWSQNNPFSKHLVTLEGPNGVKKGSLLRHHIFKAFCDYGEPNWFSMGSKRAHFTCLGTPNGLVSFLETHISDAFLTLCLFRKKPIFKAFSDLGGAKMPCTRLKKRSFNLFRHPKWPKTIFWKTHF